MAFPKVKISDNSGNAVGISDVDGKNCLDVNVHGATITGDVNVDSEFPDAAAIADNFSNPETTSVMSMLMGYDGSAWDMMRGDATNGLLVNLGSNNDINGTVEVEQDTFADLNATVQIDWTAAMGSTSVVQAAGGIYNVTDRALQILGAIRTDTNPAALGNVDDGNWSPLQVNAIGALYTESRLHAADGTAIHETSNALDVNIASGSSSGATIASYPQFDVDTSALQLDSVHGIGDSVTTAKEIIIQCGFSNTGYIVVGDNGVVAAEGVDSMDGIRLEAGDTLTLAATTTANIYLRGSENDQLVNVMVIS